MAAAGIAARLRSPRVALGGSALADLVVRIADDVLPLVPGDVLAPLVSVAGGVVGSPTAGFVTTWVMFAVALYTFGPLAYGFLRVLPREQPGFRIVFALSTVGFGVAIQRFGSDPRALAVAVPGLFLTGGLLLAYLQRYHDWVLLDPDGRGLELFELFTPHEEAESEIRRDLAYEGALGALAATLYLLALALILGFPVVIAAIVLRVLTYAFPVPDLAFLGWALSARVLPRLSVGPGHDRILDLEFDLEAYLLDAVENATRGIQGLFLTVFVVLGLFLSAGYLYVCVTVVPLAGDVLAVGIRTLGVAASPAVVLGVWNWTGVPVVLLFAGCHGIWTWAREFERLPQFLDDWEGRETHADEPPVTRVRGFVAVPVVCWLAASAYLAFDWGVVPIAYAVVWPSLVVVGAWTVRATYRRDPQPIGGEHYVVLVGLCAQVGSFWTGLELPRVATAGTAALSSALVVALFLVGAIALAFAFPWVARYEATHDGRRYAMVGLLLGVGCFGAASSLALPPEYGPYALGLGGFALVAAGALGLVRYYDL